MSGVDLNLEGAMSPVVVLVIPQTLGKSLGLDLESRTLKPIGSVSTVVKLGTIRKIVLSLRASAAVLVRRLVHPCRWTELVRAAEQSYVASSNWPKALTLANSIFIFF